MQINSCQDIETDLKPKNDLLKICASRIKAEESRYGFIIMATSLLISGVESAKLQLGLSNNKFMKLAPVVLGLVVGALSSFVKFKGYTQRLETILNGTNELNIIVTKIRDADHLTKEILSEYHRALEIIESCVTPTERAEYLKLSTKNLVSVTKAQLKYMHALDALNAGKIEEITSSDDIELGPPTPAQPSKSVRASSPPLPPAPRPPPLAIPAYSPPIEGKAEDSD